MRIVSSQLYLWSMSDRNCSQCNAPFDHTHKRCQFEFLDHNKGNHGYFCSKVCAFQWAAKAYMDYIIILDNIEDEIRKIAISAILEKD